MKKIVSLFMIFFLVMSCLGCNSEGGDKEPEKELTPPEISEKAMDNFVNKLNAGNYVVRGGDGPVTKAVSPEQVLVEYPHDESPLIYAFMTVKDETFETVIEYGEMDDVLFAIRGTAIEAMGDFLPNNWISISGGNMFELFYNNVEKPLEFTTNDYNVKKSLCGLAGYSEFALNRMEEVYMTMDAMDPTVVRFTAVIPDDEVARYYYDDLDLTLEFGAAKGNELIEKWMKDPVYPRSRTAWTRDDLAMIGNVFMRDYANEALPFPAVSSYAMIFDDKAYDAFTGILLTDTHFSEQDVEDYRNLLLSKGFTETTGMMPDGETHTVYRRLLREEYQAYSQLLVEYNDGLEVVGVLTHDSPEYEGLAAINGVITENGFVALDDTDIFKEWKARNTAGSQTEGWAYFFDYNLYLLFDMEFTDHAAAADYLSRYTDKLIASGLIDSYTPGEDNRRCESANGYVSFKYTFSEQDDNIVRLEFKNQKSLTVEECLKLLEENGIPAADLHGDIAAKEVSRYYYEIVGFEGMRLMVYQPLDSMEAAENFLDNYVPVLDEQGYIQFNPEKIGSSRQFVYLNEELAKYVGFDLYPTEDGAQILFEFVSYGEPQESMMLSAFRH